MYVCMYVCIIYLHTSNTGVIGEKGGAVGDGEGESIIGESSTCFTSTVLLYAETQ